MNSEVVSQHGGITEGMLATGCSTPADPYVRTLAGDMPDYNKLVVSPDHEMQFHLSGYGVSFEESLIKLLGESVERYALITSPPRFDHRIEYATHQEMVDRGETVVPFEYIDLFDEESYEQIREIGGEGGLARPTRDDVFGWIECPSLLEAGETVYVPAQTMLQGYGPNREEGERRWMYNFSTGTAAHVDVKRAMRGALDEAFEIDALMIRWHTEQGTPLVEVDHPAVRDACSNMFDSEFEVVPTYQTMDDVPVHVVGVTLQREEENTPFIVYGGEGGLDPVNTVYRGIMEATAIITLGRYGHMYMPASFMIDAEDGTFTDLDSNVAFYAQPDRPDLKRDIVERIVDRDSTLSMSGLEDYSQGSVEGDLEYMLDVVGDVSDYAAYLDITPPELKRSNFRVVRTLIPELVTLCMPGFPYTDHPRLEKYGGVSNEYPHPLP